MFQIYLNGAKWAPYEYLGESFRYVRWLVYVFHHKYLPDNCLLRCLYFFDCRFIVWLRKSWWYLYFIFSETARSITDPAIWLEVFSEFKSLASTWRIILSGFTYYPGSHIHISYCWLHLFVRALHFRWTKWPYFYNAFMALNTFVIIKSFFTLLSPRMKTGILFLVLFLLVSHFYHYHYLGLVYI